MPGARVWVDLFPGARAPGPPPTGPADTREWTGVMIDVLRASTTLAVALDHGAARVVALPRPAEALALREREPGALACGERGGRIVPGFDLGNSPLEYTAERVGGRTLAFASTNGSRALLALAGCGEVRPGAFVQASAMVEALSFEPRVWMLCAGQPGGFALEDAACAGWLCARLAERGATLEGPAAALVRALAPADAAGVRAVVQGAPHARELRELGAAAARDVEFCATLDLLPRARAL